MKEDEHYLEIFLDPLRKCADYKPKFGSSGSEGTTLDQFSLLYSSDPLYHWVGLDSELMYAAHKAAGGMTSVYRQLGIGCERLFREILQKSFNFTDDEVNWSYEVDSGKGRTQTLALDARIDAKFLTETASRERFADWLERAAVDLSIASENQTLQGAVFEVRQGYKSADSKRQNADLRSGMRAYADGYLPVIMLFSKQLNQAVERRYRNAGLLILTGSLDDKDTSSTYAFCRNVVQYDVEKLFKRNEDRIRQEFLGILNKLLSGE